MGVLLVLSGCQTTPKRYDHVDEGYWRAKVLVKDKKRDKSFIVNVDLNAKLGNQLRMDITTPMGAHLATLVLNHDKVSYLVVKQRKFFSGQATAHVLEPLVLVPIDPHLFYHLLFDQPVTKPGWQCSKDKQNFLESCASKSSSLQITWNDRKANQKTVKIVHPRADLQIYFFSYADKVQDKENLFILKAPKGFEAVTSL